MSLTGKDVAEIARLLDESHFSSLDLKMGDFRLRIRRDGGSGGTWVPDEDVEAAPTPTAQPPEEEAAAEGPAAGEVDVPAPLLGNFYAAPRPGDDPFVAVGDRVEEDTVIGIIEVMKLMNSVRAGVAGTVVSLLAENGASLEKGDPIIRVKAS